jgi:hypothetical protein
MSLLRKLWGFVVWLVEEADIVPFLVIVSAWHYAGALAKGNKDNAIVAVVLGVLIDLGHYRSVRTYFKHIDWKRFVVMAVLTCITGYYHWLWYSDVILAATMPAIIICLGLLSHWGKWERQGKNTEPPPQAANVATQVPQAATHKAAWPRPCKQCSQIIASPARMGAHVLHEHPKPRGNGYHKTELEQVKEIIHD